ncbi:hypothetical protein N7460_008160 [Penicillium canescens]|uniref:HNH nuclease domain-containing protein n=1 Tax=Penicillium canescens TaxID=5083 RepID=A0AAD6N7J8_PENCN|nr:hypothetical protein N7460_008160 [Penicillium canescens]
METRSRRKRANVGQEHSAAPLPAIPPASRPASPSLAGTSTNFPSPSLTNKRRRSNPPPLAPSTAPSISSVEPASQTTWHEPKKLAQTRISRYKECERSHEKCLTKTLNAALDWLPEGGRDQLANVIIDVEEDDEILFAVFDNLRTAFIEAIRFTGKTPGVTPSPHHSRRASVDKVAAKLPDPQARSSTWAEECIDRDNHRCVISGALTELEWVKQGEVEGQLWGKLEVHHIIPFSLGGFDKEEHRDVAVKWASIYTAFPRIRAIRASKINTVENGITLHNLVHIEFQAFRIALEPMETPNSYRVKKYPRFNSVLHAQIPNGTLITLRQAAGQDKPLPARDFLETHYRLCEIWHASGFAEEFEYNARCWDDIKQETNGCVLQEDGSTGLAEILETAFSVLLNMHRGGRFMKRSSTIMADISCTIEKSLYAPHWWPEPKASRV